MGSFITFEVSDWARRRGGGWLVAAGLWVGRSVGVLPPWGVIAVATPWSLGTQPPLAMWALTSIADPNLVLYKILKNSTSPR